jgi:hypothetical protein
MKNLIVVILVLGVAIAGCKKDENDYPSPLINFINGTDYVSNDTILELGETFKVGIEASNPNVNLTNFIIRVETDGVETYLDSGMNTPELVYETFITKGIKEVEKWTFIIRDKDGKSSEIGFVITKDTVTNFGGINYYPSITMGAQSSGINSFFSLADGLTYSLEDAFNNQEIIDMCYYYDFVDTDENTIASSGANIDESVFPGDYGLDKWITHRETRYKIADIQESDFDAATNDSLLIATYGLAEGKRKAKNLQTGSIFSFKNADGKVGLFVVNSISGTDNGEVSIKIKFQEN